MKRSLILFLTFCLSVSAGVLRRADEPTFQCCFSLIAVGMPSGSTPVEQDAIGENRIGGEYQRGSYCVSNSSPGGLFDSRNHTCLVYPYSNQFECAGTGIPITTKFTIAGNGDLMADGYSDFWACPATGPTVDGSYNIFAHGLTNTTNCVNITLLTGGYDCAALGSSATATLVSTMPTSTTTVQVGSATQSNAVSVTPFQTVAPSIPSTKTATAPSSCPTDISDGDFLAPHLIVPVSILEPDTSFGTSYTAIISPVNTTLFSFDIPPTYLGTCSLIFMFPYSNQVQFPFYFSGLEQEEYEKGGLDFALLEAEIYASTTYNSTPKVSRDYSKYEVKPGNNYTIATFSCPTGARVAYSVASVGNVELDYFQSNTASPMGLWIVPCAQGL